MIDGLLETVRTRLIGSTTPVTEAAVAEAVRETHQVPLADTALRGLAKLIGDDLAGAGVLQPLLAEPQITDVLVNGPESVWVDRGHGLVRAPVRFADADQVRELACRLAATAGRRLDQSHPHVDARLPDGTRLHAVLPPIAVAGPYVSLRTHRSRAFGFDELCAAGTLSDQSAALLRRIVAARLPFLISGGTGSGKTTLLAAMLSMVDPGERVVIVEDAAELRPRHQHTLTLEARHSNIEGSGAVGLRDLVRQALRMRPDRVVVGECRGAEVAELLAALNTGHDGGAGTLHANTAADVPARLAALALPHGLSRVGLHAQLAAALRVIIHMCRLGARRVVTEVSLIAASADGVTVRPAWHHRSGPGPAAAELHRLLADRQDGSWRGLQIADDIEGGRR